ncbi:hypothetical protein VitviT2T_023422 [Vitis vinifera]|uniref:Retrovirus-related Pol polyprotein from transposon TNT 1-94-like beta-barrel domain-containing protein n=1 Tax=Vitis vinifera TaxID=29760 RepID=A0ABY9DFA0_VITVI|nr:hypothetical protein VitviT2T_023422 [Vitis vinifera]
MNECHALKNRLLNENKRVSKKSSKISHNGELKGSTLNEKTKLSNVKQIWVKKNELKCFVVHTALRAIESHSWNLDSGCSHHMTGNKSLFTEFDGGNVTFGDGNMARVKGKGVDAVIFTLQNRCRKTIWPGITPGSGKPQLMDGGLELRPGQSVDINARQGWSGCFWGCRSCSFDNSGKGSCHW